MFRSITIYHLRWHKGKKRLPKEIAQMIYEQKLMSIELSYEKVNRTLFHSLFEFFRSRCLIDVI